MQIVDAKSGAKLAYRGQPSSQFPIEYSSCGDMVCAVATPPDETDESGRLEPAGRGVRYRSDPSASTADAADAVKLAWCADRDLVMPREH